MLMSKLILNINKKINIWLHSFLNNITLFWDNSYEQNYSMSWCSAPFITKLYRPFTSQTLWCVLYNWMIVTECLEQGKSFTYYPCFVVGSTETKFWYNINVVPWTVCYVYSMKHIEKVLNCIVKTKREVLNHVLWKYTWF